jgi:hypothetical protein
VSQEKNASSSAALRESRHRAALLAAFHQGLGLSAVEILRDSKGVFIAVKNAGEGIAASEQIVLARWWCRRASDAERIVAAATRQIRRAESNGAGEQDEDRPISAAIAAVADRLGVPVYGDEVISGQAKAIIAGIEEQMERLQAAGELKAVNRSYRTYRMEASARGGKILSYADWINKYKENLVREIAATLRYS